MAAPEALRQKVGRLPKNSVSSRALSYPEVERVFEEIMRAKPCARKVQGFKTRATRVLLSNDCQLLETSAAAGAADGKNKVVADLIDKHTKMYRDPRCQGDVKQIIDQLVAHLPEDKDGDDKSADQKTVHEWRKVYRVLLDTSDFMRTYVEVQTAAGKSRAGLLTVGDICDAVQNVGEAVLSDESQWFVEHCLLQRNTPAHQRQTTVLSHQYDALKEAMQQVEAVQQAELTGAQWALVQVGPAGPPTFWQPHNKQAVTPTASELSPVRTPQRARLASAMFVTNMKVPTICMLTVRHVVRIDRRH